MLDKIIQYSIHNKLIVFLFVALLIGFGSYSLLQLPIGAVPDITNNQVQVITTSRNLATEEVEKFLTYPVELEMANLPGVKEIRSISKFGLSVVTIVFDDDIGTYIPRQLIAEKIKSAEDKIPNGFGTPFMGPISTGLGEIYQYIIDVEPEYRSQYSLTDLRTLQDWTIRRQLSGIPGVIEVNTWGGYLKQYEVAVNPARLRAMNIPLEKIFTAIESNNGVAGGGYIEKTNESYFIRGEGLIGSIEDIENIVLDVRSGAPVTIKDVASIKYGYANRFGAITANGEGEKVLGQVMMLKDANSNQVITDVKQRVAEIQENLPPGVLINGFLERSELIGKTTFTIIENLVLGCLIVIFVVVVLLGNIRSGLVVASVIPLSLLFALSMMYIFGVDANLMSLGAIDFGIIIDGAVIIVEYISFKITSERSKLLEVSAKQRGQLINQITFQGASKMMHSAIFGQIIIIIVFIPILSLVNVEGKMFRPMALVFSFALIGAMILCFTYVPVMASLFIKPQDRSTKTLSSKLITFLENAYEPTMALALRAKKTVLSLALLLLLLAVGLYSQMGGEFVPTLDEGDFVIQPVLKTGTSLSKTIEMTTQMEKILKQFPEVEQVVSRIGAAEVPTDPMSMEESDIIIKLKPKREWVSANSKDELATVFKEALSVIPGIEYEFTQPIEMRFNELITGVRADLAIKVFGEDLDILYTKAQEIEQKIQNVEGAADIIVEKVAGLPQMSVTFDRKKIAKYGLNIQDLNSIITTGFAGATAGTVFEGEKQFDIVVRFDTEHRSSLDDLKSASIQLPGGGNLPLSEFATITYSNGPAKISRDDTKRRVVIGVNVRDRDLESVVKDVQSIIDTQVSFATGYSVTYGGQFENLRTATARLKIAVPIALILIFVLLYFAFSSVKDALLIYSAIPLASVGGVLLLYMRGMPFSISAGVGFIALFGIAVLNGIVLIEEFKELKAHGVLDMTERILTGTRNRLRPVLLTASAAALGFLPMAISTSAGAEVQRPLATVVIGGLISATALTLIVLPVLYSIFDRTSFSTSKFKSVPTVLVMFFALSGVLNAQPVTISLEEATSLVREHNRQISISEIEVAQAEIKRRTAFNLEKTTFFYSLDEANIPPANELPIHAFGVSQTIPFPTVWGKRKKQFNREVEEARINVLRVEERVLKEMTQAYYQVVFWRQMEKKYAYLDSLYKKGTRAAQREFQEGLTNKLEQLTLESKQRELEIALKQTESEVQIALERFNRWIQAEERYQPEMIPLEELPIPQIQIAERPDLQYRLNQIQTEKARVDVSFHNLLPDIQLEAFTGTSRDANSQRFNGIRVGLSIPLFFGAQKATLAQTKQNVLRAEQNYEDAQYQLQTQYESVILEAQKYVTALEYYDAYGSSLSREIFHHATTSFNLGDIGYLTYLKHIERAISIDITYLNQLLNYNLTVIEANYLVLD